MKERRTGRCLQGQLFPSENPGPVQVEGTPDLVRVLADLMLEALGHGALEEAVDESEDHG